MTKFYPPPEFHPRVLALLKAGKLAPRAAVELGRGDTTICGRRRLDEIDSGGRPGLSSTRAPEWVALQSNVRVDCRRFPQQGSLLGTRVHQRACDPSRLADRRDA